MVRDLGRFAIVVVRVGRFDCLVRQDGEDGGRRCCSCSVCCNEGALSAELEVRMEMELGKSRQAIVSSHFGNSVTFMGYGFHDVSLAYTRI